MYLSVLIRCRVQNALPIWHTHSTVTGSATALGLGAASSAAAAATGHRRKVSKDGFVDEEAALADHYANLDDDDEDEQVVPVTTFPIPVKVEVKEDGDEGMDDVALGAPGTSTVPVSETTPGNAGNKGGPVVTGTSLRNLMVQVLKVVVNGVPKALEDITDEDGELMTKEEYEVSLC